VHLMADGCADMCRAELGRYKFKDVDFTVYSTDVLDRLLSKGHSLSLSKMTYARTLLCLLLKEEGVGRCLYLDCDTLVTNFGVDALYDLDLKGRYAAVCDDVSMACFNRKELEDCGVKRYFNAGVILFDV